LRGEGSNPENLLLDCFVGVPPRNDDISVPPRNDAGVGLEVVVQAQSEGIAIQLVGFYVDR